MTIEFDTFNTLGEARQAKLRSAPRHQAGWNALHTDRINNQFRITWVNGTDDPNNSPEAIQERQDTIRRGELRQKLRDRIISQPELLELLDALL